MVKTTEDIDYTERALADVIKLAEQLHERAKKDQSLVTEFIRPVEREMSFFERLGHIIYNIFTPSERKETRAVYNTKITGIEELYDLKVIINDALKNDTLSNESKILINQTIFDAVSYAQDYANPPKLGARGTDREAIKIFDEFRRNEVFDIEYIKIDRLNLAVLSVGMETTNQVEHHKMQTFTEVLSARATELNLVERSPLNEDIAVLNTPEEKAILGNALLAAGGGSEPLPKKESPAAEKSFVKRLESEVISPGQERGA